MASRVCPRGLRSDPCSPGREFPHASGSPGPFPAKLSPRARAAVLWDGDEPAAAALGALCLASPRSGLRNRAPSSASKSLEETLKHHRWPPFKCAFFPPAPRFRLLAVFFLVHFRRQLRSSRPLVRAGRRAEAPGARTHTHLFAARPWLRVCRCVAAPRPAGSAAGPGAGALASPRVRPRGRGPEGAAPLSPVLTHTLVRVSAFRVSRPPHPACDAFPWCRAARWPVPFSAMKRAQEAPGETDRWNLAHPGPRGLWQRVAGAGGDHSGSLRADGPLWPAAWWPVGGRTELASPAVGPTCPVGSRMPPVLGPGLRCQHPGRDPGVCPHGGCSGCWGGSSVL